MHLWDLSMGVLGAFVGAAFTHLALKSDGNSVAKTFGLMIGVAFGGALTSFIGFLDDQSGQQIGNALLFYPIGLGYGMLLVFLSAAQKNISGKDSSRGQKVLGWLHVAAVTVATLILLYLLFAVGSQSQTIA